MRVRCILSVALLTEGEVVTLLAVKAEVPFLYWLQAILRITHKPAVEAFLLRFLSGLIGYLLLVVFL